MCHKDTQTNTCVTSKNYLTSYTKQFQFKIGSYWVYQSSTNPNIDTMKVIDITQNWIGYPFQVGSAGVAVNNPNACDSFQCYTLGITHMWFIGVDGANFNLVANNVSINNNPNGTPLALINANAPDSINYGNNSYIKLENKFDTLTVLGTRYNNVYQMHYSPAWQNFQRIWWCPNIGFVKFEFVNLQNTIDTWQLKNYHVLF